MYLSLMFLCVYSLLQAFATEKLSRWLRGISPKTLYLPFCSSCIFFTFILFY